MYEVPALCSHSAGNQITQQCLLAADLQVAGLEVGAEFNKEFEKLYKVFIQQLQVVLPQGTNIPVAYEHGSDEEQAFVQNLALFFTAFFKVPFCSC